MGLTNVLRDLRDHVAGVAVHGATSAKTAGRIIIRDADGRAKVIDPAAADDIATKGYADGIMDTERTARFNADDTLWGSLNGVAASLAAETAAREAGDGYLQDAINAKAAGLSGELWISPDSSTLGSFLTARVIKNDGATVMEPGFRTDVYVDGKKSSSWNGVKVYCTYGGSLPSAYSFFNSDVNGNRFPAVWLNRGMGAVYPPQYVFTCGYSVEQWKASPYYPDTIQDNSIWFVKRMA